ncbi:hypothetical protein Tco_0877735 [Tanacetum coccineum]|uniref:Uncharacterized protein n=1 Tax=Tanacetum coccineum TaxID=301880 RepID=A0ABQ5C1P9_9ASTR
MGSSSSIRQEERWIVTGAVVYSKIDPEVRFSLIRVREEDHLEDAFRTSIYEHFEFQVMPFGLTNAPAVTSKSTRRRASEDNIGVGVVERRQRSCMQNCPSVIYGSQSRVTSGLGGVLRRFQLRLFKDRQTITKAHFKRRFKFEWGEQSEAAFSLLKQEVV